LIKLAVPFFAKKMRVLYFNQFNVAYIFNGFRTLADHQLQVELDWDEGAEQPDMVCILMRNAQMNAGIKERRSVSDEKLSTLY